jgi:uncharacterized cupredoxin-like copper-binding protein
MLIRSLILSCITLLAASNVLASASHQADGHAHKSAIGQPGDAKKVSRTIHVSMNDNMRFSPSQIEVQRGETIKFVVKNEGKLPHEMVLGTDKELKAHYEVMKKHPHMEHADENMASVAPGQTGTIVWQFTKSGKVSFACLHPGHYDAGMKGQIQVKTK